MYQSLYFLIIKFELNTKYFVPLIKKQNKTNKKTQQNKTTNQKKKTSKTKSNKANYSNIEIVLDSRRPSFVKTVVMNHCTKSNRLSSFQHQITACILGVLKEILFFSVLTYKQFHKQPSQTYLDIIRKITKNREGNFKYI